MRDWYFDCKHSSVVNIPDEYVKDQIDKITKNLNSNEKIKDAVKESVDKISEGILRFGTEAAKL